MSINKIKEKIITIIYLILIIGNSGYMLQVSGGLFSDIIQYITVIIGFLLLTKIFIKGEFKINVNNMSQRVVFLFSIFGLFTMIANFEFAPIYLNYLSILIITFYLTQKYDTDIIISIFINTIIFVSIISLIFTYWIRLFGPIDPISLIRTQVGSVDYLNYLIYFCSSVFSNNTIRNCGIFWEPGLFASYLIIGLILEIEFKNKVSMLKLLIIILTIISTSSTAGILLIPLTIFLLLDKKITKKNLKYILFLVLTTTSIISFIYMDELLYNLTKLNPTLFSKLIGSDITKTTRMSAPMLNLSIFVRHPIFGAGFKGATELFQSEKYLFLVDSQTATCFYMLAALGVGGILYSCWWIKSILTNRYISFLSAIMICIIMFVILNKEPHDSLMATWLFLFILIKKDCKKEL